MGDPAVKWCFWGPLCDRKLGMCMRCLRQLVETVAWHGRHCHRCYLMLACERGLEYSPWLRYVCACHLCLNALQPHERPMGTPGSSLGCGDRFVGATAAGGVPFAPPPPPPPEGNPWGSAWGSSSRSSHPPAPPPAPAADFAEQQQQQPRPPDHPPPQLTPIEFDSLVVEPPGGAVFGEYCARLALAVNSLPESELQSWVRRPDKEVVRAAARYSPGEGMGSPREPDPNNASGAMMMRLLLRPEQYGVRAAPLRIFPMPLVPKMQRAWEYEDKSTNRYLTDLLEAFLNDWASVGRIKLRDLAYTTWIAARLLREAGIRDPMEAAVSVPPWHHLGHRPRRTHGHMT